MGGGRALLLIDISTGVCYGREMTQCPALISLSPQYATQPSLQITGVLFHVPPPTSLCSLARILLILQFIFFKLHFYLLLVKAA